MEDAQCASGQCNEGICVGHKSVPAASNNNTLIFGVLLLLAGLWSVRRRASRP
jgi:LPXTG-motif cell wall-anchored protein